jgi:hypothetical protein
VSGGAPDFQRAVALANVDTLASNVAIVPSTAAQTTNLGTAKHNYAGIQVHKFGTITDIGATPIAFRANNTTTGETCQWQTTPPSVQPIDLWLPLACNVGDAITVDWITTQNGVTAMHFNAYGLVTIPANAPRLRPDGLLYPIGWNAAGMNRGGTSVPAPPTGWATLIKTLVTNVQVVGGGVQKWSQIGTVNGVGIVLHDAASSAGAQIVTDYPEGFLVDPATAITGAGFALGTITQDASEGTVVFDTVRTQK